MNFDEWWRKFIREHKVIMYYESEKRTAQAAWEAAKKDEESDREVRRS